MLMATAFGRGEEASYQARRSVLWDLSPDTPGTTQGLIFTRRFQTLPPLTGAHTST